MSDQDEQRRQLGIQQQVEARRAAAAEAEARRQEIKQSISR